MAVFAWKGLDGAGKAVSGTRDADGAGSLRQVLRRDGVFLTEVRELMAGEKSAPAVGGKAKGGLNKEVDIAALFERVNAQDISIFTRQMATLLKAGIPLTEALAALAEQLEKEVSRAGGFPTAAGERRFDFG